VFPEHLHCLAQGPASRGIGAAIATRLAELGSDVAITYAQSKERADEVVDTITANGRRGFAIKADSAAADEVVAAVGQVIDKFGRLDVLVNNAGIFPFGPIDDVPLEEVDRALGIHARAVYLASQAAVRHLTDGGRIISIGSNLAERVPFSGVTLYSMSKSALIGFTKGLAHDLGERGITVNLVQPGSTDTDMNPADGLTADDQRALTARATTRIRLTSPTRSGSSRAPAHGTSPARCSPSTAAPMRDRDGVAHPHRRRAA
jgi:NAD(P)-dependent dehydrogenase (short-subunit alcohol dehydrogenase family)